MKQPMIRQAGQPRSFPGQTGDREGMKDRNTGLMLLILLATHAALARVVPYM